MAYIPAPEALPGFPHARRTDPKGQRRRWIDESGRIFEWDYQHGTVELYDRRGRHIGEFDPVTGRRLKPRDQTRWIEP
ncbi:MAG: colicin E3/pyocin S6 family cytotoxin [Alphaproteobacteria bacterium]